jgi:hypothetical protein
MVTFRHGARMVGRAECCAAAPPNEAARRGAASLPAMGSATEYRWLYLNADASPVDGPPQTFADQASAESWLGERWAELLDAGVHAVTLLNGEAEVYGPMSLHER